MQLNMLKAKIHRATVTQADLHYVGSITIDQTLMDAADLIPGQQVDVVDVTNGSRLSTYVIRGEADSGVICINGAAAHLVHQGDLVIIIGYGLLSDEHARTYEPHVVFVDGDNHIVDVGGEPGLPHTERRRHEIDGDHETDDLAEHGKIRPTLRK